MNTQQIATPPDIEWTQEQELLKIATQILDWKTSNRWSHKKLLSTFPAVGSDRTLKRLSEGDFAMVDVMRQLTNYRSAMESINSFERNSRGAVKVLPTSSVIKVKAAISTAVVKSSHDRLIVVLGSSGAGKTTALRHQLAEFPIMAKFVEADDCWKRGNAAAASLLEALGMPADQIPYRGTDRIRELVRQLERKTILLIDEAHHMGAEALSLIKTIINRTNTVVVLGAVTTIWSSIAKSYHEEALQLQHNRLSETVYLASPAAEDILIYLGPFAPFISAVEVEALRILAEKNGCFSYLRRIMGQLVIEHEGGTPTQASVREALGSARAAASHQLGRR